MEKIPFVTKNQIEDIVQTYPTPFHLYDEAGIRRNMEALNQAFSWNAGFKEYFAVKATPNPFLMKILHEHGCGCDCSSYTELMLSEAVGITGHEIMFSSNETPAADYALAHKLGAIINLDDITHIEFLENIVGQLPETMSCRYNPGGLFEISNGIIHNPIANFEKSTWVITATHRFWQLANNIFEKLNMSNVIQINNRT